MDEATTKLFEQIADANPIPTPKRLLDKRAARIERAAKKLQRVIPQSADERKVKSEEKPNKLIYPTRPTPHAIVVAEMLKRSVAR